MTSQQRADEFLRCWQLMRGMGLTPPARNALLDRLLAEERFFRAFYRIKSNIGAINAVPFPRGPQGR